jgi:chromosomal replication initiation ATPase DnaA
MPEEDFRRWFGATTYASDSGDQITVWVPTESIRRHISAHFDNEIDHALAALGRSNTHVRLVVSGGDEEDEE